jgi:hypothetical protein
MHGGNPGILAGPQASVDCQQFIYSVPARVSVQDRRATVVGEFNRQRSVVQHRTHR